MFVSRRSLSRPAAALAFGLLAAVAAPAARADISFVEPRLLPGATVPAPGGFYGVVEADLDGDGDRDVAATGIGPVAWLAPNELREIVSVWLGNGDGTFQAPVKVDLGPADTAGVAGIVAANLDQDGILDLAVAAWRLRRILVLRGLGDGTFGEPEAFETGEVEAGSLQVADLDADGDADVATAPAPVNPAATLVAVLRGDGLGAFGPPSLHSVAAFPADLVLADADGEKGPDLLVVSVTDTLSVLLNDGHGQFPSAGTPFPVRVDGRGLWAGDFDGDGTLDVLVAGVLGTYGNVCGHGCLVTVHGNGDGSFTAPPVGNVLTTGVWPSRFYVAGSLAPDLNGDGRPDAFFPRPEGYRVYNEVTVMLSSPGAGYDLGEWVASPGLPLDHASRVDGMGTFSAAAADFDGDGAPDLVAATAPGSGTGTVSFLPGVAGKPGTFRAPRHAWLSRGWGYERGLALGRLDAGSSLDVLGITDALDAAKGNGDGTFGTAYAALGRVAGPGEFYDTLRIADLNGDGKLDALWLATGGVQGGPPPRHLVALGQGDGTFALVAGPAAQAGFAGRNAVIATLDGDATNDLAVLTLAIGGTVPYASSRIEIWHNDGLGTASSFVPGQVIDVQPGGVFAFSPALAVADLDGDGADDLVAHRFNAAGGDDLVLFRGGGDGTFGEAEVITSDLGGIVNDAAAADLDGDAKLDLVLAWGWSATVLLGDGDGTFRPRTPASDLPSGISTDEVRVSDLDGDGHPDLVVGATNGVAFHRGDGLGGFGPAHHLALGCEGGGLPFEVGDLDGDGLPDLVAGHPSGDPAVGPSFDYLTIVLNGSGPVADLAVSLACSPEPVHAAEPLACTITVANHGPGPASGVALRDRLRLGAAYASASASQGSCARAGGAVGCTLGTIAPGASASATVRVTPERAGKLWHTASASGVATDPRTHDNGASFLSSVLAASADLALSVTDAPDPVTIGESIGYVFTVRNEGPSAVTGVVLTDPLHSGAAFASATPSAGTCQEAGGTVTCALGGLASGGQATVSVAIVPQVDGSLANAAWVVAVEADPDATNNAVAAQTSVVAAEKGGGGGGCGCGSAGAPAALAGALLVALWRRRR